MNIEIPSAWLARARPTLAVVEIPESDLPGIISEWLLNDLVASDPWLWFAESGYVYPNRETAARVVGRFFEFNHGHERQDVPYRVGRKITSEAFANPRLTKGEILRR